VVAHERIVDAISLVLNPKEHNNLYFSSQLSQYIMGGPVVADEVPITMAVSNTVLNLRQREALEKSVANTLTMVHGPPGTGMYTLDSLQYCGLLIVKTH
jgi:hypothetical protein